MATRQRKVNLPAAAPGKNGFNVEVNIEALTWEDMRIIISSDSGKELTPELVMDIHDLFDRIVVGGAKAVPVIYTMEAINAIAREMEKLGNPKNSISA